MVVVLVAVVTVVIAVKIAVVIVLPAVVAVEAVVVAVCSSEHRRGEGVMDPGPEGPGKSVGEE